MRVSLVITTYNWPEALGLVLESALRQTRPPDEIIVADDGSAAGTAELVASVAKRSDVPIIHSWQEDKGFRAAMSRNNAIAKAAGEYIVLIDGDIVLEKHFVADHLASAGTGFFVQGSRVIVGEQATRTAFANGALGFSLFSPGLENRKNCIRSRLLSRVFSRETTNLNGIKTCNFAFWRKDALAVNGFNEDFVGWGREDSEFAARLMNSGVHRRNLKFLATGYHLYHATCSRAHLPTNDEILARAVMEKTTWCANGVAKYL